MSINELPSLTAISAGKFVESDVVFFPNDCNRDLVKNYINPFFETIENVKNLNIWGISYGTLKEMSGEAIIDLSKYLRYRFSLIKSDNSETILLNRYLKYRFNLMKPKFHFLKDCENRSYESINKKFENQSYESINNQTNYLKRQIKDFTNLWEGKGNKKNIHAIVQYYLESAMINLDLSGIFYGALQSCKSKLVKDLLKNNVLDVNCKYQKDLPLLYRIKNPDGKIKKGRTPLAIAILNGDKETVEVLLENGADPNKISSVALREFISNNSFLSCSDAPYEESEIITDTTPLILAAAKDYSDIADLLVEKGADINTIDNNKMSAYSVAILNCKHQVEEFIEDMKKIGPKTALECVHFQSFQTAMLFALIERIRINGDDLPSIDMIKKEKEFFLGYKMEEEEFDLFLTQAKKGQIAGLKLFLDLGIIDDLNRRDRNEKTALIYAVANGHIEAWQILLKHGVEKTRTIRCLIKANHIKLALNMLLFDCNTSALFLSSALIGGVAAKVFESLFTPIGTINAIIPYTSYVPHFTLGCGITAMFSAALWDII